MMSLNDLLANLEDEQSALFYNVELPRYIERLRSYDPAYYTERRINKLMDIYNAYGSQDEKQFLIATHIDAEMQRILNGSH